MDKNIFNFIYLDVMSDLTSWKTFRHQKNGEGTHMG